MAYKVPMDRRKEYKRLVQKANRRIASAMKTYEKAGRTIAPVQVTGGIQVREQWSTQKYAISRSITFASESEYKKMMKLLKSFDLPNTKGGRPTIREYTKVQAVKIQKAIETAIGVDPSGLLAEKLSKMTAPEMTDFWNMFNEKALRKGVQYSSESVLSETLQEFFKEDIESLVM